MPNINATMDIGTPTNARNPHIVHFTCCETLMSSADRRDSTRSYRSLILKGSPRIAAYYRKTP